MENRTLLEVCLGAQTSLVGTEGLIGAEDNGEEHLVIIGAVVVVVVALGGLEDVEDFGETLEGEVPLVEMESLLTLLHVTFVGCMAIRRDYPH